MLRYLVSTFISNQFLLRLPSLIPSIPQPYALQKNRKLLEAAIDHRLCLSRLSSVVYPLFREAAFGIVSDTQSCIDWLFDFGTGETDRH
jgi:hypothetical protein